MELDDRSFYAPHPFSPFTTLCGLQHLDLQGNKLTDSSVGVLASHCVCLLELRLDNCDAITDVAMELLSRAKCIEKMETLSVQNCSQITDIGVLALRSANHLKKLNVAWCDITDKSVMALIHSYGQVEEEENIACLRQVNVNWCTQLTDATLESATKMYANRVDRLPSSQCPHLQICITGCRRISTRQRQLSRGIGVDVSCLKT